ncbi:MAG: hypothetical protein LUH56_07800 [Oscillospiraceae bacterium]|nr:hypothetical protein [Oscillospiraceae bacterium]MCD7804320.1 hypothetical protein [Oscillospiraceae bacterium]
MDIKAKVEECVKKITSDEELLAKFKKDPTGTVKDLTGVEIPEDQLKTVTDGIQAKINLDNVSGGIGKLFGKK